MKHTIEEIEKEFDKKFGVVGEYEAVDTEYGGDSVCVGEQFREVPDPEPIKKFYRQQIQSLIEGIPSEKKKNCLDIEDERAFGRCDGFNAHCDEIIRWKDKYVKE